MKELFGFITIILSIAGHTPYIIDTWRGKTKPHVFTWITLSIIVTLAFIGQWTSGAAAGSWGTGISALLVTVIALMSIRKGTKDITLLDKYCFIAALLAIVTWAIMKSPALSIILLIVINSITVVPTIRKTLNDPSSETYSTYASNLIRHILSILAISQYNLVTIIYPAYLLTKNSFILLAIVRPQIIRKVLSRKFDHVDFRSHKDKN